LRSGLLPAYPFGMQKNHAGLLFSFALLVLLIAPHLPGLPKGLVAPVAGLFLLGLLATQSRGSMVALLLAAAWAMKGAVRRRTLLFALGVGVALVAVIYVTTESELELVRQNPQSAHFKPIGSRLETNKQAINVWKANPVLGAGLRFFKDPGYGVSEPHNVLLHTLAEGGLVGLVALTVLLRGAFRATRGLTDPVTRLARFALILRLVAAFFDIYWVAGTGSLPWVLVGIAIAQPVRVRTPELVPA
jgi:O-antigen ligase